MRPMAPADDVELLSPALSTCITARIHVSGTPKRCDASVTNPVIASLAMSIGREGRDGCWAAATLVTASKLIITMAAALPHEDRIVIASSRPNRECPAYNAAARKGGQSIVRRVMTAGFR